MSEPVSVTLTKKDKFMKVESIIPLEQLNFNLDEQALKDQFKKVVSSSGMKIKLTQDSDSDNASWQEVSTTTKTVEETVTGANQNNNNINKGGSILSNLRLSFPQKKTKRNQRQNKKSRKYRKRQ